MADHIDNLLDNLGPAAATPEPPAAFLRAVARRRHQRQIKQAAAGTSLLLLIALSAALLRPSPRPQTIPGQLTQNTHPAPAIDIPRPAPEAVSLVSLTRMNAGRDADALLLPETQSGRTPSQDNAPAGFAHDPDAIERWVLQ